MTCSKPLFEQNSSKVVGVPMNNIWSDNASRSDRVTNAKVGCTTSRSAFSDIDTTSENSDRSRTSEEPSVSSTYLGCFQCSPIPIVIEGSLLYHHLTIAAIRVIVQLKSTQTTVDHTVMEPTLRTPYKPILFPPESLTDDLVIENIAATLGGSKAYLDPEESWPLCPTCSHPLVPLVQINISSAASPGELRSFLSPPNESGRLTLLQLFVCPARDGECYQEAINYSTEQRAWVLRVIHFLPTQLSSASELATRAIATLEDEVSAQTSSQRIEQARARLAESGLFLPESLVKEWASERPEAPHVETDDEDDFDEDFYADHEPLEGFKLLGYPVRGKFFCGDWNCPKETPDCAWRDLVQLGDNNSTHEAEALELTATIGNTWIMQCEKHPEVLQLCMSGTW